MRTPSVKKQNNAFSPSRAAPLDRPRNNDNHTPTRCDGNTRHGPTRGEALHALASSKTNARWSVATAPAQRPCTITKHNGKALTARCARGVEGKGEQLSPTYLEQCWRLGGRNKNILPRCVRSPSTTPREVSRCQQEPNMSNQATEEKVSLGSENAPGFPRLSIYPPLA